MRKKAVAEADEPTPFEQSGVKRTISLGRALRSWTSSACEPASDSIIGLISEGKDRASKVATSSCLRMKPYDTRGIGSKRTDS